VLIPRANLNDVVLEERYKGKIEIIPVTTMSDVLSHALIGGIKKEGLLAKLAAMSEKIRPGAPKPIMV
jgi:Lon-like ATP-dependent protease